MKIKLGCLLGLSMGILLVCGGEPPAWLLKFEVVLFSLFALAYGYGFLAEWPQPVRGMALVYLGVGAAFVDPRFPISALLIGTGTRMVMVSFKPTTARVAADPSIVRQPADISLRESGGMVRH